MRRAIREVPLQNGLTLRFFDATRRYFGDYHQVRLEISCDVELTAELFDNDSAAFDAAVKVLGATVRYLKQVEHQGVATEAIDEVVEKTIADFLEHSLCYFESNAFPQKLVHSELKRHRNTRRPFLPMHSNG